MVDFHSHILPHMDDGSHSSEESLRMLAELSAQGVDTVAFTPHFYADFESPQSFFERREEANAHLRRRMTSDLPRTLLGAEVQYFSGVSHIEALPQFCLEGTRLLLLEMPFSRWSDYAVDEVIDMNSSGKIRVMLAHIERYLIFQKRSTWDHLLDNGIIMQSNAEFFIAPVLCRQAVRMFCRGRIHFLGTDCHNMTTRGVHMAQALKNLGRLGRAEAVEHLQNSSDALLEECSL